MSVALRGNLKDFGIADVFQLIGQQRKTGILEFSRKRQHASLAFDRGAVVSAAPVRSKPHAELGDMLVRCGMLTRDRVDRLLRGCEASAQPLGRLAVSEGGLREEEVSEIEDLLTRETIFDLLRWSGGSFDFHLQDVEHDRALESLLGAEQILMDGLRMVDEWQSFAVDIPTEEIVFRRVQDFDVFRAQAGREMARRIDEAERVFYLVDGRLAVRRVIDLSLLGTFDATRVLAALRRAGCIEPVDAAGLRRLRRLNSPGVLGGHPLRTWVAALIPLALLVAANALVWHARGAAPEPTGFPIARAPLDDAREAYAQRRVRNALGTHRFASGSWPAELGELAEKGILPAESLASRSGHPYYYAERDGAAVLLAPQR